MYTRSTGFNRCFITAMHHSLPGQLFAAPAARVLEVDHTVAQDAVEDEYFQGLSVASHSQGLLGERVIFPRLGAATAQNRKKGGDRPERGTFLGLRRGCGADSLDSSVDHGVWVMAKSDFLLYENGEALMRGDVPSAKAFEKLADHESIVNFSWEDVVPSLAFEPCLVADRNGAEQRADIDGRTIGAVLRWHTWKKGRCRYKRLELIDDLLEPGWTMDDLLGLAPADMQAKVVRIHPRPPSGLVPLQPSFVTVPDSVMLNAARQLVYTGGGPGELNGLASYKGPGQRRSEGKLLEQRWNGGVAIRRMYNNHELASMGVQVQLHATRPTHPANE